MTGRVLDGKSGKPLEAVVWCPAIETEDVRRRTSEPMFGRYRRFLMPGKYTVVVSREGYQTKVVKGVEVRDGEWTSLDIPLDRP